MFALDVVLSLLLFGMSLFTLRTGQLHLVKGFAALVAILGTISTIYFNSSSGMFWVYVSTLSLFYLLGYRIALICNLFLFVCVSFLLLQSNTFFELLPFFVTIALICIFAFLFALTVDRMSKELKELSLLDDLTNTNNRRAFSEKVDELISLYNRVTHDVSLIYFDIDHFKEVNDKAGHSTGDEVLLKISKLIKSRLRITDSLYRLGGDEFVIVAEGTNQHDASLLAEELRQSVSRLKVRKASPITISMGVAQLRHEDSVDSWISRADNALYKAKESGRNSIKEAFQY